MTEFRSSITYEDVVEAANSLRADGLKVSTLAVREKLGRGSFTTVKKFLDRLVAQDQTQSVAPPVPAQLESLWIEARRVANEGLDEERKTLETLAVELDTKLSSMEIAVQEATTTRLLAEARLADRLDELNRTLAIVEELRSRLDRSEALRESAEAALEVERRSAEKRWQQTADMLAAIDRSIAETQRQGAVMADQITASTKAITAKIADFNEIERRARASDHESLTRKIAESVEPFASLPGSIVRIERHWQLLTRRIPGTARRGLRGR